MTAQSDPLHVPLSITGDSASSPSATSRTIQQVTSTSSCRNGCRDNWDAQGVVHRRTPEHAVPPLRLIEFGGTMRVVNAIPSFCLRPGT